MERSSWEKRLNPAIFECLIRSEAVFLKCTLNLQIRVRYVHVQDYNHPLKNNNTSTRAKNLVLIAKCTPFVACCCQTNIPLKGANTVTEHLAYNNVVLTGFSPLLHPTSWRRMYGFGCRYRWPVETSIWFAVTWSCAMDFTPTVWTFNSYPVVFRS